jgi:LacI family transcriptional regulator
VLGAHPTVTAIMAGNDLIALGVLRALKQHGLSSPGDMSVVGFNDMRFADAFDPPLTTVRIPQYELGCTAAELLLAMLATPTETARTIRLPVSLVVRGSTGAPRRTPNTA